MIKHFLVISLFIMSASALAIGNVNTCKPCPNGTQDIILEITDSGLNNEYQLSAKEKFHNSKVKEFDPSGKLPIIGTTTANVLAFRDTIMKYANECKRIKFLSVATHGGPGFIKMQGDFLSFDTQQVVNNFKGVDCAMATNAKISLIGCQSAKGCEGELFMRAIASIMLPKGGTVEANSSYYSTNPLIGYIVNRPPQVLSFGPGLKNAKWEKPQTSCNGQAVERLSEISAFEKKVKSSKCGFSGVAPAERKAFDDLKVIFMDAEIKSRFLNNKDTELSTASIIQAAAPLLKLEFSKIEFDELKGKIVDEISACADHTGNGTTTLVK